MRASYCRGSTAAASVMYSSGAILITIGFHAINVTTISSLCLNLCNVYASPVAIFHKRQASVIANAGCHAISMAHTIHTKHSTVGKLGKREREGN